MRKNSARVQNCPDITILNTLVGHSLGQGSQSSQVGQVGQVGQGSPGGQGGQVD